MCYGINESGDYAVRVWIRTFSVLLLAFTVSGCGMGKFMESRMPWTGVTEGSQPETVSTDNKSGPLTPMDGRESGDRLSMVPGLQPVPAPVKPSEEQLMDIATQTTRSKVQVYGSDGAPSAPIYDSYGQGSMGGGIPAAADSAVTIFPVGGDIYGSTYMGPGVMQGAGTSVPSYSGPIEGQRSSEGAMGSIPAKVYFGHGSSALDGEDRRVLSNVAEQAKFAPVGRVSVEGHASSRVQTQDPVEGRIINLKQSMNRAVAVSNNLIQNGVPPEKIKTVSWGDTKPPMDGSEAEARRVDVYTGGN